MIIAMDTKKWNVNRGANIENKTSPQTYIRRKMNWHSKGHNVFLKVWYGKLPKLNLSLESRGGKKGLSASKHSYEIIKKEKIKASLPYNVSTSTLSSKRCQQQCPYRVWGNMLDTQCMFSDLILRGLVPGIFYCFCLIRSNLHPSAPWFLFQRK